MRLCFVIQRYGPEVAGGAEMHCRWLAERLAQSHEVQVVTTCALDYIEWRNHYPPGEDRVGGLKVTRHPVVRPRSEHRFALVSELVFGGERSRGAERAWVEENGPRCPALVKSLSRLPDVDLFLFYCYRYYQTFFGLPRVADRAVLVPTAEEDPAIELSVFHQLFRAPRGIVYLTPEEQALVEGRSANQSVPSVVVGSGVNIPEGWESLDVRAHFGLPERFLLYVGRIDRNKGVDRLLRYYEWLGREWPELPPLVLAGKQVLEVPEHPKLKKLGFISEAEKFALLSACQLLLMPSPYESLSIIALESWAVGRPLLANGQCKVLEGQCLRSGGGLFYEDFAEFSAALRLLLRDAELRERLGRSGRAYVKREYAWPRVAQLTESLLERLLSEGRESGAR
jgi:glycosyltransferase involved in cell wall biosynthesis